MFGIHPGACGLKTGERGTDGHVDLQPGDVISIPNHVFRGFENIGSTLGFMFAVLGGEDPGPVHWSPYFFEAAPPPGVYVRVRSADTGHGMAPGARRQAFDPFFTTKGPGGSGLGLSQVYGMARQSGGTVLLDSTEGKGTEVALLLPRSSWEFAAAATHRRADSPPPHLIPLKLTVVDSDAAIRPVTVERLHALRYQRAPATAC